VRLCFGTGETSAFIVVVVVVVVVVIIIITVVEVFKLYFTAICSIFFPYVVSDTVLWWVGLPTSRRTWLSLFKRESYFSSLMIGFSFSWYFSS
jgi:hypothetical protein